MKRSALYAILLTALALALSSGSYAESETEEAAVKKVIEEAYVKGIHIERDIPAIEKGFHPDFDMLIFKNGEIRRFPLADWIGSIKKGKEKNPGPPPYEVTSKIPMVDVAGNAAVARVEIFRDSKHIYTDYMSLYKFEDGWKIVRKIYFRHPD
jgi:hypothetical protein